MMDSSAAKIHKKFIPRSHNNALKEVALWTVCFNPLRASRATTKSWLWVRVMAGSLIGDVPKDEGIRKIVVIVVNA